MSVNFINLNKSLSDEEYEYMLKNYQKKLNNLQNIIYKKKIPVIIAYEGWDAAGKGGNIRRITEALDPRVYEVQPIASPEPHEKARHYLWRFWNRLPKSFMGENTVFLLLTALIRNFYKFIMARLDVKRFGLKATSRIKAFVFKFISVPAKWGRTSRQYVLNIYSCNNAYADVFQNDFG